MPIPCGQCKGGIIQGAICNVCNGTTFMIEQLPVNETPMPEEVVVPAVEETPETPVEVAPEVTPQVAE